MASAQGERIAELEEVVQGEVVTAAVVREELQSTRARLIKLGDEVRDRTSGIMADATEMIEGVADIREDEFIKLKQGTLSVSEYEGKFTKLSKYAPELVTNERKRIRRFVQGLNVEIHEGLAAAQISTETLEKAQRVKNARMQVKDFHSRNRKFSSRTYGQTSKSSQPSKVGRGMGGIRTIGPSRGALSKRDRSGPVHTREAPSSGSAVITQVTCGYCGKSNHSENECWRKSGKCLACGSTEHQLVNCRSKTKIGGNTQRPEKSTFKQTSAGGSRPKVPARVYALDHQQIPDATEMVEGTVLVFHCLAKILIDPSTTHYFVNLNFMNGINLKPIKLSYDLEVKMPTGDKSLIANLVYRDCEICVGERKLLPDLIGLAIKRYDVILGRDWLARYNVQLNCRTKIVKLYIPGEATLKLDVRDKLASSALISRIRAKRLINKGVQGYLAFLINTPSDKVNLEDMPVVKDFLDVFPEELESLSPERDITFKIDVIPGVTPISKTPYRMAPTELKELNYNYRICWNGVL
ncbi:uncharacterized protein [Coffea arabica]|uniref:CCHC-type domain-containing protein n=1 Tax=Coffea arabica TaxID=13443 RepID=A0ABM4WMN5_COFAR